MAATPLADIGILGVWNMAQVAKFLLFYGVNGKEIVLKHWSSNEIKNYIKLNGVSFYIKKHLNNSLMEFNTTCSKGIFKLF